MKSEDRLEARAARKIPKRVKNVHAPDVIHTSFSNSSDLIMLPSGVINKLLVYITLDQSADDKALKGKHQIKMSVKEQNKLVSYTFMVDRGANVVTVNLNPVVDPIISFITPDAVVARVSLSIVYTLSLGSLSITEVADEGI